MNIKLTSSATTGLPMAKDIIEGVCFMRPNSMREKSGLYMRVAACGAVRRLESVDDRAIPVVNLRTGTLFFIHGTEVIIPMHCATVISDTTSLSL